MSKILRNNIAIAVIGILAIALVATLVGIATVSIAEAQTYNFARSLKQGMSGSDVMDLQKLLNMSADTQVAASGVGSPGNETSYFGGLTRAAVVKWQNKNASAVLTPAGLSSGTGFFGSFSRAFANGTVATGGTSGSLPAGCTSTAGYSPTTGQSCSSGVSTIPTTGGALSVGAASQPVNALAPGGTSRVPFTRVTLTAGSSDVTVSGVTVERVGPAVDAVFTGVSLLDENGVQLGIAKTFNSNHQATVGDPFVVKAGTSRTMTIAGNMATIGTLASYAGQVVGMQVNAVNTGGTVSGSLPIVGAMHTINATLVVGTAQVSISSFDPNGAQSREIGTTGYKFSGIKVTAGSAEQVRVKTFRFNQIGSVGASDLSNVMVYVDGTAYPTTVSSDGKYFTANFGSGIVIDKGLTKEVYIQGDISGQGASGRNVQFDIYKATDIYVTGETYGYGITVTAPTTATAGAGSQFTTATPFFDGSLVTITAGSITTVSKATSVAAQNIAVNVPNQILGGFEIDLKGEPISVQSLAVTIATSTGFSGATGVITNISLYGPNGNIVAGPKDQDSTCNNNCVLTFTDTVTFPIGKGVYTLKGKIPSNTAGGSTVIVSTQPSSQWQNVTGQTTGNTISMTTLTSTATMNTMTVKAAALAISAAPTPSASSIVAGGTVTFANFLFDATQSGEDVRFSSVALTKNAVVGLSACQLFDGSLALNTGSNVHNPAVVTVETITLDQSLIVTKGTVKTLTLKCNVSSAAVGPFTWTLTPSTGVTVTGVTSSGSVTATGAAATSASLAIANGSLTVTTGTSPSYVIAAAGSAGIHVSTIRFRAANEAVNLTRIGLTLTSGTSTAITASSSPSDIVRATIWDGTTKVGEAYFNSNVTATSTLDIPVTLPKDADKDLQVKVDLYNIDTATNGTGPGTEGAFIQVDNNATLDSQTTRGSGVSSGATINATGSTVTTGGVRMFKSYPTFAVDTSLSGNGVSNGNLMRFKVTASAGGSGIGINQFKFTMSTTSATVTAVNLFGYTNATYDALIPGFTSSIAAANVNPSAGGAVTITPSQVITVPANTTYYFELRGTVTGTGTAYSVNTTLLGDAAYPSLAPAFAVGGSGLMAQSSALTGGNLIWSPNATTTSAANHDDWTNAYGVSGLPSNGISFNRAQ